MRDKAAVQSGIPNIRFLGIRFGCFDIFDQILYVENNVANCFSPSSEKFTAREF